MCLCLRGGNAEKPIHPQHRTAIREFEQPRAKCGIIRPGAEHRRKTTRRRGGLRTFQRLAPSRESEVGLRSHPEPPFRHRHGDEVRFEQPCPAKIYNRLHESPQARARTRAREIRSPRLRLAARAPRPRQILRDRTGSSLGPHPRGNRSRGHPRGAGERPRSMPITAMMTACAKRSVAPPISTAARTRTETCGVEARVARKTWSFVLLALPGCRLPIVEASRACPGAASFFGLGSSRVPWHHSCLFRRRFSGGDPRGSCESSCPRRRRSSRG